MDYLKFTERREELGISIRKFADIIGYTEDAVKKWKKKDEIPKWAVIVLDHLVIKQKLGCHV